MGKRTNDFQTLIAIIEAQLAPAGAAVTESKMVFDPQAGVDREVDIYIEVTVGHHPITIGVECIDKGRPGDTQWVEQQMHKHEDLGTSQLVLVSRSGFTKGAREKAEKRKVRTLTLDQAAKLNWNTTIAIMLPLLVRNIQVESVKVNFMFEGDLPTCLADQLMLVAEDGEEMGWAKEEVAHVMTSREMLNNLVKSGTPAGKHAYRVSLQLPVGTRAAAPGGAQYPLELVVVGMVLDIEEVSVPLQRSTYGDVDVASVTTEIASGKISLAVVGDPSGGARIAAVLKPGKAQTEQPARRHLMLDRVLSLEPIIETPPTSSV